MNNSDPIGVFDSGMGGLTVVREMMTDPGTADPGTTDPPATDPGTAS